MDSESHYELMNTNPYAGSTLGRKHTEKTKVKMSEAAKRIAESPEERAIRSVRLWRLHVEGRIPPKPLVHKPKHCKNCNEEFIPARLPSGFPSKSGWCDKCRPPHRGGTYKTEFRLPVGVAKPYVKPGPRNGFKHSDEVRKVISEASKFMWERIRFQKQLEARNK